MADFKKSVDVLRFIKDLSMPQQAGKIVKASDAYAPFADQGIFTAPTMADRTVASATGKLKGGMRFPHLQNVDPAYEGEVWGFGAGNMSTRLLNQFENVPSDKLLLSTILGNKYMHHSNPEVSAELIKQYRKGIKSGNLSDELRDVTNRRINQLTDDDGLPIFAPDSDVTDPAFYRSLDTFDKRAAMGNIMGGVGLNEGTERKRRVANQIFDYEGLMRKMTEPSIISAPNSSIGSRIFTLSGTKSERPDLNKAYQHVVGGLDLNVDFGQVPFQHYLKDYTDNMMQTRGKVPGWFNLTRSSDLPTQEITDKWLQHLKNQGYKDGGAISPPAASMDGDQFFQAAIKAGMSTDIGSLNKIVDLVNKGMSISEAIEALTGQTHKRDGGQVEHMQAGGVKKAIGALGELAQSAPKINPTAVLSQAEREVNKAKFLEGVAIPETMYHGTNKNFSEFYPNSYFSIKPEVANRYGFGEGRNVMPVNLGVKNVARMSDLRQVNEEMRQLNPNVVINNDASFKALQDKGFDAFGTGKSEVIVFDPKQIKSAIGNRGTYDINDPDITKAEGGAVHMQHGGIMPRAGIYYPTSNDERNQAAGLPADFYRKGMTDVASHGYHVGVDVPAGDARLTADLMGSRYVSPQMTRDAINALRLGAEFPVGEGMLRAEVMKGLAPNVPTNVGLRYSRPFAEGGAVEHMQAGGLKTLMGEVLNKGGTYAARRLQRAADEIPNLETLYKEQALRRAFGGGDNASAVMTMNPADFEKYSIPIHPYFTTKKFPTLVKDDYSTDDWVKHLKTVQGYDQVPHLSVDKGEAGADMLPIITGHEGRHRNRALADNGVTSALIQFHPRSELREPFPRRSQEQYIDAIRKEMQLTGNRVKPEQYYDPVADQEVRRRAIAMPDLYADGGRVEHMQAGGLKTLMGEVLNRGGSYAARRLERAADEIPNLEKLFQEETLKRTFLGDNARAVMTMRPSEFENYAEPLLDLSKKSRANIANLKDIQGNTGFSNMPFLMINKEKQGSLDLPFITAHEGRHRSRAMDAAGEQASLVQLFPRAELREPFPRRSEQEYIEALRKEMALTGNKVMPEKYYDSVKDSSGRIIETRDTQRPAIDLPDIYAEGGVVHKQAGGMMGLVNEFKALQAAHNAARLAKTTRNIPPVQDMVISQADKEANLARYLENAAVKDRMYHATGDDFSVVDVDKSDPRSKFGTGFYMTPNTNYANFFANMRMKEGKPSQVMPVYTSVKNPYEISGTQNIPLTGIDREKLKALGHDGVLFRNDAGNVQEVVAFDPTQVKSAIGNRGTFDPTEVELTKAEGGAVHSQIGGMTPEPAGGSARQETFAAQHMAEGGDIMRSLFDHALDNGDIHEMTHAMLVKQHEAEHG